MPDQHGFGDNGTESTRPRQSGQGDDQMNEYDSEVAHSGNGINSKNTALRPIWQFAIDNLRRDVLRPAAESVGIKGITFQALRRTFATHFHRVGTIKDQQSQMRHSNAQTTMNVYTQTVSESLKEAMEEFDRKMSKLF